MFPPTEEQQASQTEQRINGWLRNDADGERKQTVKIWRSTSAERQEQRDGVGFAHVLARSQGLIIAGVKAAAIIPCSHLKCYGSDCGQRNHPAVVKKPSSIRGRPVSGSKPGGSEKESICRGK